MAVASHSPVNIHRRGRGIAFMRGRVGADTALPIGEDHMNQFAIDRRTGALLMKFAGPISTASLNAFDGEPKSFVAREGTMSTVIDFTGASVEVEVSLLIDQGRGRSLMPGESRVFVTKDSLLFGLLRICGAYQYGRGGKKPLIVPSLVEAFRALALADPQFEP